MRAQVYGLVVPLLLLTLPVAFVLYGWFLTSDIPNAFEGLANLSLLSFLKQFVTKYHAIPVWNSMRNFGLPLTFFLLPGWWVWNAPLILMALISDEIFATKIVFFFFAVLSSCTMYMYAYKLTNSRPSSVIAGWAYSSAGSFVTVGLTHVHVNFAMFWALIPLFFLALDRMFLRKTDFWTVSTSALIGWGAFSAQPLFFLTFGPFFVAHIGFRLYLLVRHDQGGTLRKVAFNLLLFVALFLLLNLWWIVPQFKYESLYLTPIYLTPSSYTTPSPLNAPTFIELVTMQTFAGGGTEAMKDAAVSGIRSLGFLLPFSLSLIAPLLAKETKEERPEVYYFSTIFIATIVISTILIISNFPFPSKVVAYAFVASVLTAFSLKYAIKILPAGLARLLSKPKIRVRWSASVVLVVASVLVLSSGYFEMHRLAQTYSIPQDVTSVYDFIVESSTTPAFLVLNVPFTTPLGKPYYSTLKSDNFIGLYYSYLEDYVTVKHGLRNAYGAINEYESNHYPTTVFHLLDQALRNGNYNDFANLLRFFLDLKYIVVYKDLVDEDVSSFLKQGLGFKTVYQNSVAFVLESPEPCDSNKVWINESPLLINMANLNNIKLLATLINGLNLDNTPIFILNEDLSAKAGLSMSSAENRNAKLWAFESEDIVNDDNKTAVSQLLMRTNMSSSNGKCIRMLAGESIKLGFETPLAGSFNLSIRVMNYTTNSTLSSIESTLSFLMDSKHLGSYEMRSDETGWKWLNFTGTSTFRNHTLEISCVGNRFTTSLIDAVAMSDGARWDELLYSPLRKTFEINSRATGHDITVDIPSNISSSFLLVINEAYFPSWELLGGNIQHQPVVANGFLNGFLVEVSDTKHLNIGFTPSLEENMSYFISIVTFVAIMIFVPTRKAVAKIVRKRHKKAVI